MYVKCQDKYYKDPVWESQKTLIYTEDDEVLVAYISKKEVTWRTARKAVPFKCKNVVPLGTDFKIIGESMVQCSVFKVEPINPTVPDRWELSLDSTGGLQCPI